MLFLHQSPHKGLLIKFVSILLIAGVAFFLINHNKANAPTTYDRVETEGTYVCLPKKDTGGAVTMECALGLQADSGLYYGLDFSVLETTVFAELQTGARIAVEGAVVPVETLSAERWRTYDIEGIILVASGEVLEE